MDVVSCALRVNKSCDYELSDESDSTQMDLHSNELKAVTTSRRWISQPTAFLLGEFFKRASTSAHKPT